MKALPTLSLLVLATLAIPFATAQRPSDRPPGVATNEWVAINENLGVVLSTAASKDGLPAIALGDRQGLLLAPPAQGYFMVRTANRWKRLVVIEPLRGAGDAG